MTSTRLRQAHGAALSFALAVGAILAPAATSHAASPQQTAPALAGTSWKWTEFRGGDGKVLTVEAPENYTVAFGPDGKVAVKADCNTGGGSYAQDGNSLKFGPIALTMMACPPGGLGGEFLKYLDNVRTFVMDGDALVMNLFADAGDMRFLPLDAGATAPAVPDDAPDLTGTRWMWARFEGGDGGVVEVANSENYLLDFGADGRAAVKADCNTGSGPFAQDGFELDMGPFITTLMACPPESLGSDFMRYLDAVSAFAIDGDNLVLSLEADAGKMTLAPMQAGADAGAAPAAPVTTTVELAGTAWQWTAFTDGEGKEAKIDDPSKYTIEFGADGRAALRLDCNRGGAAYTLDGDALTFGPILSTKALCPPESMADEFAKSLEAVAAVARDGDALVLSLAEEAGKMTFAAVAPAAAPAAAAPAAAAAASPLEGRAWNWRSSVYGTTRLRVRVPRNYTIEFLADGTVAIRADCNRVGGTYTVEGDRVTIELGPSTRVACARGSLGGQFLRDLDDAIAFTVRGRTLTLGLEFGAGSVVLTR